MKGFVFILGLFGAFLMCTAITQQQIDQLLDLNRLFDILHKEYDMEINRLWFQQKHNMKVLNAQFLSRFGFNIEEMKDREMEVLEAVESRVREIGDNECIQEVRSELENAVDYAHTTMAAAIDEVFFAFNETNEAFFYPNVEIFHFESNTIQWEILNALLEVNPVADMDGLIQRLLRDYYVILELYEIASVTLETDIRNYDLEFNSIRATVFATFQNSRDYFVFTCNAIQESLSQCT